jgi:hypothetical protein
MTHQAEGIVGGMGRGGKEDQAGQERLGRHIPLVHALFYEFAKSDSNVLF